MPAAPSTSTTSGTIHTMYWGEKTFVKAMNPATAAAKATGSLMWVSRTRA